MNTEIMKKYAVTGSPIFHSLSPQIFNHLFVIHDINAHCTRLSAENGSEIIALVKKLSISGLSITAPFKQTISDLVDTTDPIAEELQAINTISNTVQLSAYNTDVQGIQKSLANYPIGKMDCVILGAGGASSAAIYAVKSLVKSITILNRTIEKAETLAEKFGVEYSSISDLKKYIYKPILLINTIPGHSDFDFYIDLAEGSIFLDANYVNNSYKEHITDCGAKYISGHVWLLNQAKTAFDIFFNDFGLGRIDTNQIFKEERKSTQFALIGFMGAGKTTIGKLLADSLGFDFIDTDNEIEEYFGKNISAVFEENGEDEFRKIESQILQKFKDSENIILSCGGGIIERHDNLQILKDNFKSVYLYSDLETCLKRVNDIDRPLLRADKQSVEELYQTRLDKYFAASDLIINSQESIESIVTILSNEIKAVI